MKQDVEAALTAVLVELEARGTLAVLAGAGASRPSPSNLPLAGQLMHGVLERILPADMRGELADLLTAERMDRSNPKDFLRFETLCQMLVEQKNDEELTFLDCLARCTSVNRDHLLLAGLLQQGHVVLTTNFDDLIERACGKRGFACRVLAHASDYRHFEDITPKHPLLKLHGSFELGGKPARESLRACLDAIVKAGAAEWMEPDKARVLHQVATDHDLLVLGYSGADDFDILPALANVRAQGRKIVWIQHQPDATRAALHNGKDLERMPRDASGYHLAPHVEFLATLIRQGQRAPQDVVVAEVNADEVISILGRVYGIAALESTDEPYVVDLNTFLDDWAERRFPDSFHRAFLGACALIERARYEPAWKVLEECDRTARPQSPRDRLRLASAQASILIKTERFDEADKVFNDASDDILILLDQAIASRWFLDWSDIHYRLGRQSFANRDVSSANASYELAIALAHQGFNLGFRADNMELIARAFLQTAKLNVARATCTRFDSWTQRSFAKSYGGWRRRMLVHFLVAVNSAAYRYAQWSARRGFRDAMQYAREAGHLPLYCASALELADNLHTAAKYRTEIEVLDRIIHELTSLGYNELLLIFYRRLAFAHANAGDALRRDAAMALALRLSRRMQVPLEGTADAEPTRMEKKDFTEHREAALLLQEKIGAIIFEGDWGNAMSSADEALWDELLAGLESASWNQLLGESDAALVQRLK